MQRPDVRDQAAHLLGRVAIGLRSHLIDEVHEHAIRIQPALGPAAFVRELAGDLLPAVADRADDVFVGDKHVVEYHFVEIVVTGEIDDGVDADARRLEIDDELRDARVPVRVRARRRAREQVHEMGHVRITGPDFGAFDAPTAIDPGRFGAYRREVRSGIRLAHADADETLPRRYARQIQPFLLFGTGGEQQRSELPVGQPMRPDRRACREQLLGDHVTFQRTALVAAASARPRHADPAARGDFAAERGIITVPSRGLARIGARRQLGREKRAHFVAQLIQMRRQLGSGQAETVENHVGCGAEKNIAGLNRLLACLKTCRSVY